VPDIALEKAREAQASRITGINLVIGKISSIVDDCVQFYFDFLSRDSIASGAVLSFTRIPMQVEEMKNKLEEAGKKVTGTMVIDFLCEKALVRSRLRARTEQVESADSMLVMTCGIGVQAVAAVVNKVCHPACNTVNPGGSRGE